MHKTTLTLVCAAIGALAPLSRAQEEMGAPAPAAELKKLEPLIGNWSGKGVYHDPAQGRMPWTSHSSCAWSHDGFWIRENLTITFENVPSPMVFHSYLGWDGENKRYVNAHIGNNGEVALDEMFVQPDGSIVMLMTKEIDGKNFCERSFSKVTGDTMSLAMEFLMTEGPSMTAVEGELKRVDKNAPDALAAGAFVPMPHADMDKLAKGAGVYDVKGSMTMAPGMPPMNIYGTDTYKMIFGGAVLHGHTDGAAEGMPGKYAADVFWGWDKKRGCYTSVYVSNMGEVGQMSMWYGPDGKQLISTSANTQQGTPAVQRFVLTLHDDGSYKTGVGHTLMGTHPPMESFKATYTKKKKT